MKTRVSPSSQTVAFTLVELLTVIAIIAILMGLLFPAIGAVKESARKTQAKNDVMQILTAVKQYSSEYGKYPTVTDQKDTNTAAAEEEAAVGDPAADMKEKNNNLFNTLRALAFGLNANHKYNPRRVVFFEGKSVTNTVQPRGGFVDKGSDEEKGIFYDPWGREYNVVLDSDFDNVIKMKKYYADVPDDEAPHVGVVAFSLGKDNQLGKDGDKKLKDADDVISWK